MAKAKAKLAIVPQVVRLDIGCGMRKKEGFHGIDCRKFDGVDTVMNAGTDPWPWATDSVEEAHASHFVEHLSAHERIHFANELHRVLVPGGKALIITPNWSSARAYGDLTHQWPPVSEWWFLYLNKDWRTANAPHNDQYTCDFESAGGYSLHQAIQTRNQEYQQHAITFWKEAAQDLITTLTKK